MSSQINPRRKCMNVKQDMDFFWNHTCACAGFDYLQRGTFLAIEILAVYVGTPGTFGY